MKATILSIISLLISLVALTMAGISLYGVSPSETTAQELCSDTTAEPKDNLSPEQGLSLDGLPGKGMDYYDYTTPEKALRSKLQMALNSDIRAEIELSMVFQRQKILNQLETLSVEKKREYGGKKILFIKWRNEDMHTYELQTFEKDADSALWQKVFLSPWTVDNKDLAKEMEEWESKN